MTGTSTFATGARAATGRELQEAQRRYRLLMHKSAPAGHPIGEGGAWHCSSAEQLVAQWPSSAAGVVELQIDSCNDVALLARLAELPALEALRLGGLGFIAGLHWLPALPRLRALRLEGFGRGLTSLQGVAAAPALEALVLDPRDELAAVESLAPLACLTDLRLLVLPRIATIDASLRPLAGLQKLELFHGTAYYGPDEYEALAGSVPALRCPWFSDLAWQLL
jgi:hypothetical protein